MKSYIFSVTIEEDAFPDGEKAHHAFCPALVGCHTWGHTQEEALTNIQEAVQLYVEDLMDDGSEVPVDPSKGTIQYDTPSVVVNMQRTRYQEVSPPGNLLEL